MRGPIDAYLAGSRRAALTDVADTTVRRISREIRTALPNSIRNPTAQCLEFIPTKTGGRYRTEERVALDGSSLIFNGPDTTFNMLGSNSALPPSQRIVNGDVIVVYNLGIAGAEAYAGENTAVLSAAPTEIGTPAETTLSFAYTRAASAPQFPLASPNNRFQVVPGTERVVGYVCSGGNLIRRASAVLADVCTSPGTVTESVLARGVTACSLRFNTPDLLRNSLVNIVLELTESGETARLEYDVHVNNTP